jgi:hypothetical protein
MSHVNIPAVSRALFELAAEIATHDRSIAGVQWYTSDSWDERIVHTPILPRAVHDALCPRLSVLFDDQTKEILVCDTCSLAIENGAG